MPHARSLVRTGRALVELYCASFRKAPKQIVLDIDDTFDAVHGDQQQRLFNAHSDENGFQPMVVFDGEGRFITAVLRTSIRPNGTEIRAHLGRHIVGLEATTKARFAAAPTKGKVRRFTEYFDGAESWSRVERIIARVEAEKQGSDTRFIVTNLAGGKAKTIYERIYWRRGTAENHIKAWKAHLAADRTSCPRATANQFRLFLHAGAY